MAKPFLDIEGQAALLGARGLKTDDETLLILLREGYYPIVNGYKEPFLDSGRTAEAGDDRYKEGTSFNDLYSLFKFDRKLREVSFHYLLQVEALAKTICVYTFCESHRGVRDYLDQGCFASEQEYRAFGLKDYWGNIQKLQGILNGKAENSQREFIRHYREHHGGVPLWVLANDLTFGNIEHFYNLMKPGEQKLVCKRVMQAVGRSGGKEYGFFSPGDARVELDVLVRYRNICAHDERLYCAKVGRRQNWDYTRFISAVGRYLTPEDFESFQSKVMSLVSHYSGRSGEVLHILTSMGFLAASPDPAKEKQE
ncbi:hypothetical protein GMI69_00200 [Eggerthellaceae bacterium zg-887]|uniref:Abi family protein n=1 Tax=Xiamenia xianingshaonis TaxID=2682776 RepID=UPI001408A8DD|nr:Abi family protein [Xiamenia xianingshaonis]NHM15099.1 hypothetical protein [Xiamenia xianingshaonis]